MNFCTKRKFERFYERKSLFIFGVKGNLILRIFGCKVISFSTQEIGRKIIFFYYLRNLHDVIRNEKDDLSVLKKGDKITFSLVSNAMLTGYQKVLVLKSSEMENTVFYQAKKLMKR